MPDQGVALAFIYCDHKENLSQRIEYFLGAIIRQVVERTTIISEDIRNLYSKHRGKGISPGRTEYLALLQSLTKEFSEVYIVIDALDECIDKDRRAIWKELLTVLKNSVSNLRLLCTSRHLADNTGVLAGSTCIPIRAEDTDIRTYILAELQSRDNLPDFCVEDPALENNVVDAVISKSDGV